MADRSKVKITVVEKVSNQAMFGDAPPVGFTAAPQCDKLEVGREFIRDETGSCPSGLYPWVFANIQREITHLRLGGNFLWIKEPEKILACCTDGVRPVVFKLKSIGE